AFTAGMPWMLNCMARVGFSSVFTFTISTRPPSAAISFSRSGPSTRQGPHQGAQKSTTTGRSAERASTASAKFASPTSSGCPLPAITFIRLCARAPSGQGRGGRLRVHSRPPMLTVGVISDTHGLVRPEALAALQGCAHILHAGDVGNAEVLATLRALAPVTAVRGNNDR